MIAGFAFAVASVAVLLLGESKLWASLILNLIAMLCVVTLLYVNRGMPYPSPSIAARWIFGILAVVFVVVAYYNFKTINQPPHLYWQAYQNFLLACGLLVQQGTRTQKDTAS